MVYTRVLLFVFVDVLCFVCGCCVLCFVCAFVLFVCVLLSAAVLVVMRCLFICLVKLYVYIIIIIITTTIIMMLIIADTLFWLCYVLCVFLLSICFLIHKYVFDISLSVAGEVRINDT